MFGLINSIVKPIVKFFSIPFLIVTLGLFTLIINTAMLWFTVKLLPGYIELSGFWSAFWGALVISVISVILHAIIDSDEKVMCIFTTFEKCVFRIYTLSNFKQIIHGRQIVF